MDSTLVQGILDRLDVVAAKVGVGAEALWGVWLATAYRPLVHAAIVLLVAGGLLFAARRQFRLLSEDYFTDDDGARFIGILLSFAGAVTVISGLFMVEYGISSILFPEFYAADRLKGLVSP